MTDRKIWAPEAGDLASRVESRSGALMSGNVSPMQTWFTKAEAAEYLRVSPRTIDRWVEERRIRKFFLSPKDAARDSVRFMRRDLDGLLYWDKPEPGGTVDRINANDPKTGGVR